MDEERSQEFGMPEGEEAGFVRAAQRGDRVAFIALARCYWPTVARVVGALTGSPEVAARRTLDVFEHAWKGLHFMPDGLRFYVWVHRIAFNLCQAGPIRAATTAPKAASEDAAQRCGRAFAHLSTEHQRVLALRAASHLEVENIARILELSPAAAQAQLSEARADLHSRWTGGDPTASLRHFSLQQLSDYVGTDPAAASEFVRAHFGQCDECRRVLTALEAQERIVTALLADAADGAGLEPFLNQLVERVAGERHAERMTSAARPVASADQASGVVATTGARAPEKARRGAPATRPAEPRAVSAVSPTRPSRSAFRILVVTALVIVVVLGVRFGSRIEPWLESQGIHFGGPKRPSPTQAASVKRFTAPPEREAAPAPVETLSVAPLPEPEEPASAPSPVRPASPRRKAEVVAPEKRPPRTPASAAVQGATPATNTKATAENATAPPPAPASQASAPRSPASVTTDSPPAPEAHRDTAATQHAPPPRAAGPRLVCGRVADAEGKAVERAQLNVTGVELVVLTDRLGRFCFSVPSGDRTLSVLAEGFQPLYRKIGEQTSAELSLTLEVAPPPRRP